MKENTMIQITLKDFDELRQKAEWYDRITKDLQTLTNYEMKLVNNNRVHIVTVDMARAYPYLANFAQIKVLDGELVIATDDVLMQNSNFKEKISQHHLDLLTHGVNFADIVNLTPEEAKGKLYMLKFLDDTGEVH